MNTAHSPHAALDEDAGQLPWHDHRVVAGWAKGRYVAVGGLTEVGFSLVADLLLVVSHSGRGVIGVATSTVVARDPDVQRDWFDPARPAALGIGPVAGEWIEVSGLAGGHLCGRTDDGWRPSVQASGVVVEHAAGHREAFFVAETEEVRAAGFSSDGSTLIVAASPGVTICQRLHAPR